MHEIVFDDPIFFSIIRYCIINKWRSKKGWEQAQEDDAARFAYSKKKMYTKNYWYAQQNINREREGIHVPDKKITRPDNLTNETDYKKYKCHTEGLIFPETVKPE